MLWSNIFEKNESLLNNAVSWLYLRIVFDSPSLILAVPKYFKIRLMQTHI